MSKKKKRRLFRVRPATTRSGITDLAYFVSHPEQTVYLRPVIEGEFTDATLPPRIKSEDIQYVLVRRLPYWEGQERIPLTIEEIQGLKDQESWRHLSGQ